MSIVIKNVKMPPSCGYCPFFGTGYGGQWWCHAIEAHVHNYEGRRDEHCPLIELPPHGDLIDRDALMKDGWLSLWKRVDYMGGYAIHDLPLINPSISVIIESEGENAKRK